jgi:hypothetical protein
MVALQMAAGALIFGWRMCDRCVAQSRVDARALFVRPPCCVGPHECAEVIATRFGARSHEIGGLCGRQCVIIRGGAIIPSLYSIHARSDDAAFARPLLNNTYALLLPMIEAPCALYFASRHARVRFTPKGDGRGRRTWRAK